MKRADFLIELANNALKLATIKLKEKDYGTCKYWINNAEDGINSLEREVERIKQKKAVERINSDVIPQ